MIKNVFKVFLESFVLLALCFFVVHYLEVHKPFNFPTPTGLHTVGSSIIHWIDNSRLETHAKDNEHPYRQLMGQMWYPADAQTPKKFLPYHAKSLKNEISQLGIPNFLLTGLDNIFTHACMSALPERQIGKFPVVIVDHGIGGVGLSYYTGLCEELASQGYFVIGVNHTYAVKSVTFPDGRVVTNRAMPRLDKLERSERLRLLTLEQETWVQDIQFVLDKLEIINRYDETFKGKLDLANIGIVGHSFGGSTAVQMCRLDQRIKVGINMDGALRGQRPTAGFDKPFMFLMAHNSGAMQDNRSLFNNLSQSYYISVDGMHHDSFSDGAILVKRAILFELVNKMVNGLGLLDGYRAHAITCDLVVDFFNKYLQEKPSMVLDNPSKKYKEVTIEHK